MELSFLPRSHVLGNEKETGGKVPDSKGLLDKPARTYARTAVRRALRSSSDGQRRREFPETLPRCDVRARKTDHIRTDVSCVKTETSLRVDASGDTREDLCQHKDFFFFLI